MLTDGGEDREHDAIQADQLEVYELGQLDDVHRLVERQAVVRRRQALQIGMDMPWALLWGQAAGKERCRHLHSAWKTTQVLEEESRLRNHADCAHIVEDVQGDQELARLQHPVRLEFVLQAALLSRLQ